MSLSSNYPTSVPTLNLDFANVGALDPRITFTRATTATYTNSLGLIATAASGVARFDYDPTTLAARGLLIEEQRSNTCTYSEDITNAVWSSTSATVSANAATSPDGTVSADSLTYTSTNGQLIRSNAGGGLISISGSTTYTISVWLKVTSGTFKLKLSRTNGITWTTATVSPELTVTTEWQRFTLTYTSGVGETQTDIVIGAEAKTPYTLPATGTVLIWGVQHEAGSFATSYIPTVASTVTRNADVASINTLTPWYNQTEGTVYAEVDTDAFATSSTDRAAFEINDTTVNNFFRLQRKASTQAASALGISGGSLVLDTTNFASWTTGNVFKLAIGVKANDVGMVANGGSVSADTSYTMPTVTRLELGGGRSGDYLCGHLRRVAYYPRRLTNAQLQALTS